MNGSVKGRKKTQKRGRWGGGEYKKQVGRILTLLRQCAVAVKRRKQPVGQESTRKEERVLPKLLFLPPWLPVSSKQNQRNVSSGSVLFACNEIHPSTKKKAEQTSFFSPPYAACENATCDGCFPSPAIRLVCVSITVQETTLWSLTVSVSVSVCFFCVAVMLKCNTKIKKSGCRVSTETLAIPLVVWP